jgi:hypothetical protein
MKLKIHYQNHGSVGILFKFLLVQPVFMTNKLLIQPCSLQIYFCNVFYNIVLTVKFWMATSSYIIEEWYLY